MEDNSNGTNTNQSSAGPISRIESIVWLSAFAVDSISVVLANLVTIILFGMNRSLRKRCFYLLVNMTFADLMVGALSLPMYTCWRGSEFELWQLPPSFDIGFRTVDTLFLQASLISVMFISGDRLYACGWPLKYRTISTTKYLPTIFAIWLVTIFVSVSLLATNFLATHEMYFFLFSSCVAVQVFTICCCYIAVAIKFKQGILKTPSNYNARREKRLTKTLMIVTFFTWLLWCPTIVVNAIPFDIYIHPRIIFVVDFLQYSNSILNPIIYSLRIPEFRKALLRPNKPKEVREARCIRMKDTGDIELKCSDL